MAVGDNSGSDNISIKIEEASDKISPPTPRKRTTDPGVRVKHGRIYDSENGKTCHQCRQKTRDFAAFCKRPRNGKPCPLTFCHKCLRNRYGEKVEDVEKLDDWSCPKCRGVCNCSFCMKRKGYQPTGILAHTAKAAGFNSVLALLHDKGDEVLKPKNVTEDTNSPVKSSSSPFSNKGSTPLTKTSQKENQYVEKKGAESNEERSHAKKEKKKGLKRLKFNASDESQVPVAANGDIVPRPPKARKIKKDVTDKECTTVEEDMKEKEVQKGPDTQNCENNVSGASKRRLKKKKHSSKPGDGDANQDKENAGNSKEKSLKAPKSMKHARKVPGEPSKEEIVLPAGMPLTEIAGVEIPAEDVGAALQFLEFCNAFSEVLDIKEGQPDIVLRELSRGRAKRHGVHSALVEFNIKLLSLIEKDMKKKGDAWVQTLRRCIEQSECTLKELPMDCLNRGSSGYDNLNPSTKLKILNFLCDELLGTDELRNWIDEVAVKFDGERKEQKEKNLEAKKKEKLLKQQAKDDIAKAALLAKGNEPLSLSESDELISQIKSEADRVCAELLASVEVLPKRNQRSDAVRTDPMVLGKDGQIFWKLSGYNNRENIILQDIGNWDAVSRQDKWSAYNEEEEKVVEKYISSLRNCKPVRHTREEAEEGNEFDWPNCLESQHCLPEGENDKPTIHANNRAGENDKPAILVDNPST